MAGKWQGDYAVLEVFSVSIAAGGVETGPESTGGVSRFSGILRMIGAERRLCIPGKLPLFSLKYNGFELIRLKIDEYQSIFRNGMRGGVYDFCR